MLEGGIPFEKAHGMTAFEHHGGDPRFNKLFNDSMRNHSTILIKQLLETYRGFDDVKVLVDVGGGTGATLHMITSRHPHIKGVNFDLPLVIASAPTNPGSPFISDIRHCHSAYLLQRSKRIHKLGMRWLHADVEHVSGDMFESIPGGGDAIFMKNI